MAGSRIPGPIGLKPDVSGRRSASFHRPGPIGTDFRFPTLEVFSALHGDLLSRSGRSLTQNERDLAQPIFEESINYHVVRIVVAAVANSPTTLGNFIRISPEYGRKGIPDETLIHELTHIWQFQTRGMRYMSNSLCQQVYALIAEGDRNFAYTLTGSDIARARSIYSLSAERQAMLVEYWFTEQKLQFPGESEPSPLRQNAICQSMIREVQSARPLPIGQILDEAAYGPGSRWRFPSPSGESDEQPMPLIRFEF